MNMASLWQLPVVYVCENNLYNEYTHYAEVTAGDLLARASAFGIEARAVDGQDVRAVLAAAEELVERARRGDGPSFLVCNTYRFHGHHVGDVDRAYYRAREEEDAWQADRDPLAVYGAWLAEQGFADADALGAIEDEARAVVEDGVEFALAAPFPDPSEVVEDVYA